MRCARCGQLANPGDGAMCRYCNGPLVADDRAQAYGAASPYISASPAAPKRRGIGMWRGGRSIGGILLTIAIIGVARAGLQHAFGGGTSTIDASAHAFSDGLTSNVYPWTNNSHAFFRSDGYHITQSYIEYAPVKPQSNVDISVQVVQISGDITWDYGIVFREASKGNYLDFAIDSNGVWRFDKAVNDQLTNLVPATTSGAIHRGLKAGNNLEVRAEGSHYVFLVNGTQVGEADDATYTGAGKVGLLGHDNIEVVYSHLAIKWHN